MVLSEFIVSPLSHVHVWRRMLHNEINYRTKKKSSWSRMKTLQSLPWSLPISLCFLFFFHPHCLHHPAHGREQLTVIYHHFPGGPPTSPEARREISITTHYSSPSHSAWPAYVSNGASTFGGVWEREKERGRGREKWAKKWVAGETSCEAS